jgi:hypothetical protein
MENQIQVATKFMLYAYFKLDINETEDEIIRKALDRAYADATNEGAYNTRLYDDMKNPTEAEKKKRKNASDQMKNQAAEYIRAFLNGLDSFENVDAFDEEHGKVCQVLVDSYEKSLGNRKFTYGNAQKWVNMTLKYLYLLGGAYCACGYPKAFQTSINHCKAWLHVPIDSYIIEALYKVINLPRRKDGRSPDKIKKLAYSTIQSDLIPWSQWEEGHYISVFSSIREYGQSMSDTDCALVWENKAWTEVAKRRNGN